MILLWSSFILARTGSALTSKHKHMYALLQTPLKISSVSYRVPEVVPTILRILFDSAQCSSGGHVSIYAE